jgi:hypothetical protein
MLSLGPLSGVSFEGKQKVATRLAIFSARFTHMFTCSTLKKDVKVGHMTDTNYSIPFPGHFFSIARMPSRTSGLALSLDSRLAMTVSSLDLSAALFLCRPPNADIGGVRRAFPLTSLTTIGTPCHRKYLIGKVLARRKI